MGEDGEFVHDPGDLTSQKELLVVRRSGPGDRSWLLSDPAPTQSAPDPDATCALDDPATQAAVAAVARRERRPLMVFAAAMALTATVVAAGLLIAPDAGWWAGGALALMVATSFVIVELVVVGLAARKRRRWTRILTQSRWRLVEAVVLPKLVPPLIRDRGRAMVLVLDAHEGTPAGSWAADHNAKALKSRHRGERTWSYLAVDPDGTGAVLADLDRSVLLPLTDGTPSSHRWAWDTAASLWELAPPSQPSRAHTEHPVGLHHRSNASDSGGSAEL